MLDLVVVDVVGHEHPAVMDHLEGPSRSADTEVFSASDIVFDDVTVTQLVWTETIAAGTTPQTPVTDAVVRSKAGRIVLTMAALAGPTGAI